MGTMPSWRGTSYPERLGLTLSLAYPSLSFRGQGYDIILRCSQKPISLEQSYAEGTSNRGFDMSLSCKLGGN